MKGKEFFKLESEDRTFVVELRANCNGFKRHDCLVCRKTVEVPPGMIAIVERDDCGRWPMKIDEAGPELAAGARVIGQALALSRDLDHRED